MSAITALAVASEIYPLIKTGGLADVTGALPAALKAHGIGTRTLVPGYPELLARLDAAEPVHEFPALLGGPARLLAASKGDLDLFILNAPHLYGRAGNPYVGPDGKDWPDNAFRFAALAKVAAAIAQGLVPAFAPDIVHAHDWQAALTPAYLRYSGRPRPATIVTIHNLAFQGLFPRDLLAAIELPPEAFTIDGVEYYGAIGFLKAGLQLADRLTTVSPTYAREIQEPETGMGLDGLLRARARDLSGILNGIDDEVWNPATDERIAATYGPKTLAARARNKEAVQKRFGLRPEPQSLVMGIISRLSSQKGLDLIIESQPVLFAEGIQLALLGAGDAELEASFRALAQSHPGQVGVVIGYDEDLAHLVQAGADALAVPSRFEPCGLTQLCALRYGAVPVVARVGGLADTVVDANDMAVAAGIATGVQFGPVTADMLAAALRRTHALFRDEMVWRGLQTTGMATDVSWRNPAHHYANLYRDLAGRG